MDFFWLAIGEGIIITILTYLLLQAHKKMNLSYAELCVLHEKNSQAERYFQEKSHIIQTAYETTQAKIEKDLQSLCAKALQENNRSFLDLAGTVLEKFQSSTAHHTAYNQQAMSSLITPLSESLSTMEQKIQELEKNRIGAYESLRTQIKDLIETQKDLRNQTGHLVSALRTPHVRGRWGEVQLRRVVEIAGMVPHCDFQEQTSSSLTSSEFKRGRPDLIVHLPEGRSIVVDAKAPLNSYLDALDAPDERTRSEKMKDHARHVRNHIKALSSKSYWEQFHPTPEFVILFLPGEFFFSAALEQDTHLLEYGADSQVILATPTTLIALLKAVSFGWRQVKITENAEKISALGREIYKRLADMNAHFSRLGHHLGTTVQSYNETVGSLEHRVLPTARRFEELGLASEKKKINPLNPLDHQPRYFTHDRI